MQPNVKKVNYLNNRDILSEIHISKNSYCTFSDPTIHRYDIIIDKPELTLDEILEQLSDSNSALFKESVENSLPLRHEKYCAENNLDILSTVTVTPSDCVFRIMTWDHIPVSPKIARKTTKKKSAREIFDFDSIPVEDDLLTELEADLPEEAIVDDMLHAKVNFPPFQHFKLVLNNDSKYETKCVGKSHWLGDLTNGEFSTDHGQISNNLAKMYLVMCQKYSQKFNWRGYCVDDTTEALTKRGWLNIDEINEDDTIMSYNNGVMTWSPVKSVYRGDFDGKLFKLTNRNVDMLITPNHKLLTREGLKKVELLKQSDTLVLMGDAENSVHEKIYSDSFVELAGWIFTEGCYDIVKDSGFLKGISIYQNEGPNAQRIRNCITESGFKLYERFTSEKCIAFSFPRKDANNFYSLFPKKIPTMEFICSLTPDQRELLIDTMIEGDGWYRGNNRSYTQKSADHLEVFEALCAISGIKTKRGEFKEIISFGKPTNVYEVHLYSKKNNVTKVENVDMYGAAKTGRNTGKVGKEKINYPNEPTVYYKGRVWCPETEYGIFLARRNNHIYLTGNTYIDEMTSSAVLQLTYVGLRFNESKSNNPFAYFTQIITNSFCRILNTEKKSQNIRDDLLEMSGLNPSWSRNSSSNTHYEE